MRIYISGQGYFARQVLSNILQHHEVVGVACPIGDQHIGKLAHTFDIPITPAGSLSADTFPEGVDLAIAAHSFDYVGRLTRYRPKLGWLGYHPSLLPRHRGRSSIEWAIRMRDPITGGTWFWLNAGIDRGDIAYQDWCFIDPALYAMEPKDAARRLWRGTLQGMGIALLEKALDDLQRGVIRRAPQDQRFSTWEPGTEVRDVYRPDALMLPAPRDLQALKTRA